MSILSVLQRTALLVILLSVAALTPSLAQDPGAALTFDVTAVQDPTNQDLLRQGLEALRTELEAQGAVASDTPDWTFLLGAMAVESGGEDQIILSVVTLYRLPEKAVQLGAEAEVFYAHWSDEKRAAMPAEGKPIRERVSEDFLRQYGTVHDHELMLVDRSDLEAGVAEIVRHFFARHTRQ